MSRSSPNNDSSKSSSSSALTKTEKGRYKKLLKRAKNLQPERQVSGITNPEDWTELQQLIARSSNNSEEELSLLLGPSVTSRVGLMNTTRTSPIDAADHRDILFRLLMMSDVSSASSNSTSSKDDDKVKNGEVSSVSDGTSSPHKRKRTENGNGVLDGSSSDDNNNNNNKNNKRIYNSQSQPPQPPRWPHWACVHNPAAVESAAVFELHVRNVSEMKSLVTAVENLVCQKEQQKRKCKRICHTVPTTWFPNLHHPQSISSALLYSMANNYDNKNKNKKNYKNKKAPCINNKNGVVRPGGKDSNNNNNLQYLYEDLLPLTLTDGEQKSEGYPVVLLTTNNDEDMLPTTKGDGEEDGRLLLKSAQVEVSSPHDDARLPRFVSTTAAASSAYRQGKRTMELITETGNTTSCNNDTTAEEDSPRQIFALDCEMVQTTIGSELARATLVQLVGLNEEGKDDDDDDDSNIRLETSVCFDRLVKPLHPVVDYLTMYSGITKEKLQEAQDQDELYSLEQIQMQMLTWIRPDDILIGHSLENDVIAMRCHHARVVDTAVLFRPVGAKFKYSLRHLSVALLRKSLRQQQHQNNGGEKGQHCSQEDAEAALELAVRRAWEGPAFGAPLKQKKTHSNQLIQLASSTANDAPVVSIGPSEWLQQHVLQPPSSIHALTCESIDDRNRQAATAWLSQSTQRRRRARLVWAHWKHQNKNNNDNHFDEKFMKLLEELLSKISHTTMIVVAIQVGYEETAKITAERRARMKPRATMAWKEQEQTNWLKRVHACRNGTVLWIGTKQQA